MADRESDESTQPRKRIAVAVSASFVPPTTPGVTNPAIPSAAVVASERSDVVVILETGVHATTVRT
jgi:hypothetical protein